MRKGSGRLTANLTGSAYRFKASKLPRNITLTVTVTGPDGRRLAGATALFTISVPGLEAIVSGEVPTNAQRRGVVHHDDPGGRDAGRRARDGPRDVRERHHHRSPGPDHHQVGRRPRRMASTASPGAVTIRAMPVWRCPHCASPQPESSRCWVCRRSTTSCATCRHFRRGVAGGLGLCGLDPRRSVLEGTEMRACWTATPRVTEPDERRLVAVGPGRRHERDQPSGPGSGRQPRTFVPVEPETPAMTGEDASSPAGDDHGRGGGPSRVDLARDGHGRAGPGHVVAVGRPRALAGPLARSSRRTAGRPGAVPGGVPRRPRRFVRGRRSGSPDPAPSRLIEVPSRLLLAGRRILGRDDPGARDGVRAGRVGHDRAQGEAVGVDQGRGDLDRLARVVADVDRRRGRASAWEPGWASVSGVGVGGRGRGRAWGRGGLGAVREDVVHRRPGRHDDARRSGSAR